MQHNKLENTFSQQTTHTEEFFRKVLKDSAGFCKILQDSARYCNILQDFTGFMSTF